MRLLVSLFVLVALTADEVILIDGTVLDGTITAETADEIALTVGEPGMRAVHHLLRTRISSLTRGPSARERTLAVLDQEAATLGDSADAEAWAALAVRAKSAGDRARAKRWATLAVERNRGQVAARGLLNQRLVNGVWMNAHEAAVAAGLLWHEGDWLSFAERAAQQAEAEERGAAVRRHEESFAAARTARRSTAEEEESPWPVATTRPYAMTYGYTWWPRQPRFFQPLSAGYRSTSVAPEAGSSGLISASGSGSNSTWAVSWSW